MISEMGLFDLLLKPINIPCIGHTAIVGVR
jgi:hypothetical protein